MHAVTKMVFTLATPIVLGLGACSGQPTAPVNPMSFFVTSVNPGKGADLGGLAGADAHCEALAATVGAAGRNWRAYLSTTPVAAVAGVNARDRIGKGPWQNAKGELEMTVEPLDLDDLLKELK